MLAIGETILASFTESKMSVMPLGEEWGSITYKDLGVEA
jgi:hypothetical protein